MSNQSNSEGSFSFKKYFTYCVSLSLIGASVFVSTLQLKANAQELPNSNLVNNGKLNVVLVESQNDGDKVFEVEGIKVEVTAEQLKMAQEALKQVSSEVSAQLGGEFATVSALPAWLAGLSTLAAFISARVQISFYTVVYWCARNFSGCYNAGVSLFQGAGGAYDKAKRFATSGRW